MGGHLGFLPRPSWDTILGAGPRGRDPIDIANDDESDLAGLLGL
jgi:hypothetical protein